MVRLSRSVSIARDSSGMKFTPWSFVSCILVSILFLAVITSGYPASNPDIVSTVRCLRFVQWNWSICCTHLQFNLARSRIDAREKDKLTFGWHWTMSPLCRPNVREYPRYFGNDHFLLASLARTAEPRVEGNRRSASSSGSLTCKLLLLAADKRIEDARRWRWETRLIS